MPRRLVAAGLIVFGLGPTRFDPAYSSDGPAASS
jgi:hypothetical protein